MDWWIYGLMDERCGYANGAWELGKLALTIGFVFIPTTLIRPAATFSRSHGRRIMTLSRPTGEGTAIG